MHCICVGRGDFRGIYVRDLWKNDIDDSADCIAGIEGRRRNRQHLDAFNHVERYDIFYRLVVAVVPQQN